MKVLAIGAHPDDVELGCGATLAKHASKGDEVSIVVMGRGIAARDHEGTLLASQLERMALLAHKAGDLLGARQVDVFEAPDNRMDELTQLDVVKLIEERVRVLQPDIVYTHYREDRNVDHRITSDATVTACRFLPGSSVRMLLAYEVMSSTEQGWCKFDPNYFVEVDAQMDLKMHVLRSVYESEMREFPHPRSIQAVEALARLRGSQVGVRAAESFVLVRARG